MRKIIVVNKKDEIIGTKEFDAIESKDIYRISALWIINSKNEVLIAQRALSKKIDPGKWGPSVAGTLDEGEAYESNIVKEAEEEIGLKLEDFKKGPKIKVIVESVGRQFFCQSYIAKLDKKISDFTIQKDEVEKIQWIPIKELILDIKNNPEKYTASMRYIESHYGIMKML